MRAGSTALAAASCWMRCAVGPRRGRELENDELGNDCTLSGCELAGGCGRSDDAAGHMADHAPHAHLLAGGADLRCDLPDRFLPRSSLFRCPASGFLSGIHAVWLVVLVGRGTGRTR